MAIVLGVFTLGILAIFDFGNFGRVAFDSMLTLAFFVCFIPFSGAPAVLFLAFSFCTLLVSVDLLAAFSF